MGVLAYQFHFQPSELWEFEASDFEFWKTQLERINRELSAAQNKTNRR